MNEILFGNSPLIFGLSRDFFINILTSVVMGFVSGAIVAPFTARYLRRKEKNYNRTERLTLLNSLMFRYCFFFLARTKGIGENIGKIARENIDTEIIRSEL